MLSKGLFGLVFGDVCLLQQILTEHLLMITGGYRVRSFWCFFVSVSVCGVRMSFKVLCGPMPVVWLIPKLVFNVAEAVLLDLGQVDN